MAPRDKIWIVDDDKSIRWVLERALTREQLQTVCFENAQALLQNLERDTPDLIISDIRMPGLDGVALLEEIKLKTPEVPVIIMTAFPDLDRVVSSFQGGAYEYLSKPFDIEELLNLVKRAIRRHPAVAPGAAATRDITPDEIVGSATAMQEVFRAIGRLSASNLTVLVTGESGTGKELVAQALHRHSPRAQQRFIAINVAAIPRDLLESELFGHEKGAFTGATAQRKGRFEQAGGGTLFLDEIGDMPADLQTRLLRVLSTGAFYRVGGHLPIDADVRVIAATNQELEQQVSRGTFREDLFHRLNVIRVHVPALRDRREDIPVLTEHFLRRSALELNTDAKLMLPQTQTFLNRLDWPGNVRQLENFCRWITVMAPGKEIHIDDLPPELGQANPSEPTTEDWESTLRHWVKTNLHKGETGLLGNVLPAFERILIEEALQQTGGRRVEAAKLLGWGRNTLTRKIKGLDLKI
ncbi:MAG: nitrogen regulation protein NR(I) [Gammaproteobacteria bacterium]|nr:nitrogen regulation protein NR(I) [Gammaproteobacteria bacterium]MCY4210037.1 nitrogen regulation protein NR(I) [Gammaproteobacteria bacterium]MCY4282427.1 nitrogen regulation protein NR(I) [Gammaproteobacteria bacterium]MCY4338055.1 nitrogen regulation protein NR(I) [Gammaproteobacteria bacterium]